jgi:hypothetical protein
MRTTLSAVVLVSVIVLGVEVQHAHAVISTMFIFIIPNSIPLTNGSRVTAMLLNPDGSHSDDLIWTYNGTDFTPQNEVKPIWPSDDYIDFHDSNVWHYAFTVNNATVGQRYLMCLQVEHLVEYEDKQCEWQVVDQTGMAVVNFEDPAKDGAS